MAFHDERRLEFLSRPPTSEAATILGSAAPYDVRLQPADVPPGEAYWRVVGIHHLLPHENRGRRHIYVDVVDSNGARVRNPQLRLRWGWEGQRPGEHAPARPFDKADWEPHTNLDVYSGQHIWIRVEGDGLPSDTVANLHTKHADEPGPAGQTWNSIGHHSFYILFQRVVKGQEPEHEGGENGSATPPQQPTPEPTKPEPQPEPAEPVVSEPPPLPAVGGNKLGFYLHLSTDQHGLWNAIRRVQPPVLLIHADTANRMLLQEIRRFRAPDAFVIGRMYKDNHTQRQMLDSDAPGAHGRAMADEILRYDFGLATQRGENGRLLIDAWMGLNEAVPGPGSQQFRQQPEETARLLRKYDEFQAAFRAQLQEAGVEAVAFNFGAGNFSRAEHYLEHFPKTLESHVYLGFHEYGWPTLFPSEHSATSAGTYRRCMEGIRERYGDRHRAIITEAGLTRMYQNPAWGDKGWLNDDAPLTEEQYWRSLDWYNRHMLADEYVLGACLYEVGHHGQWETFRHLGRTDSGEEIRLLDRVVALREAARSGTSFTPPTSLESTTPEPATPDAAEPETMLDISGTVSLGGLRMMSAAVRLLGGAETLGRVPAAALDAPSYVTWTRRLSGFEGSFHDVWVQEVAPHVAGISWPEFSAQLAAYNPSLIAGDDYLDADETYWLPENRDAAVSIVWDRPLTGFEGSMDEAWARFVRGKVVGLSADAFRSAVRDENPNLDESAGFVPTERYRLPRNEGHKTYAMHVTTDVNGRFTFGDLPPGAYELRITAPAAQPYSTSFSCQESVDLDVTLLPLSLPGHEDGVLSFDVAAPRSARVDFVRVLNNEFVENGHTFSFVGVNIRGLAHYGDTQTLPYSTPQHREEQLQAAYDMGARVVRIFLPSMHANADATVDRLRTVIELVRSRFPGMYILPALCNLYADVPFRVPGDEAFYRRIDPNWGGDLLAPDFFTGGFDQNFVPFVRKIVTAFRDEPSIFGWEVGNELKLNPAGNISLDDPHLAAFIGFMHRAARLIRSLDPNHLITTGLISTHHCWMHSDALKRRLYDPELFDFMTVHCYNEEYVNDDSELARSLNMPFIVEEAGFGNNYGSDRSGPILRDMERWFNCGARGYMQWGFMATGHDMGDGDGDSGMDRTLHSDWDALFRAYRGRADALAQQRRPVSVPPEEFDPEQPEPTDPASFKSGTTVYAQTVINVRSAPGHRGESAGAVLGQLAAGTAATITGESVAADGLIWWPIEATLSDGQDVDAWAAQSIPGQVLLTTNPPSFSIPRGMSPVPVG